MMTGAYAITTASIAHREHQVRTSVHDDGTWSVTVYGPWLAEALDAADTWWARIEQHVADERAATGTRFADIDAMPGRARTIAHLIASLSRLDLEVVADLDRVTSTGPAQRAPDTGDELAELISSRLLDRERLESEYWAALRKAQR